METQAQKDDICLEAYVRLTRVLLGNDRCILGTILYFTGGSYQERYQALPVAWAWWVGFWSPIQTVFTDSCPKVCWLSHLRCEFGTWSGVIWLWRFDLWSEEVPERSSVENWALDSSWRYSEEHFALGQRNAAATAEGNRAQQPGDCQVEDGGR